METMFADEIKILQYVLSDIDLKVARKQVFNGRHSVGAHVVGGHLDNAFGNEPTLKAIMGGYQEYLLCMESFNMDRQDKDVFHRGVVNLASLLAVIRMMPIPDDSSYLGKSAQKALAGLRRITKDCRDTMHEPDEQDVSASIRGQMPCDGERTMLILIHHGSETVRINCFDLFELAQVATRLMKGK